MKYKKGNLKRIFLISFEEGDDIIKELKKMAEKEKIKSAVFFLIGALEKAEIVAGPSKVTRKKMPAPNFLNLKDGMEVLAAGTLFKTKKETALHIHGSYGQKENTFCGCLKNSKVYITAECFLFETGFKGGLKNKNNPYGINLLDLK